MLAFLEVSAEGGSTGSGGLVACGASAGGGGARGAGRSSGCGGGGCDRLFFPWPGPGANDDDACSVGREGTSRFCFRSFTGRDNSSGTVSDSVMIAESAGMFSDVREGFGVSKGFSGSGVDGPGDKRSTEGVSRSSSGTTSPSVSLSIVESCWCVPTPPRGALRESRRKRSARREGALLPKPPAGFVGAADADSRAAFRLWRSAISQRRRFCKVQEDVRDSSERTERKA